MVSMTGQAPTSSDREREVGTDGVTAEKGMTCARWREADVLCVQRSFCSSDGTGKWTTYSIEKEEGHGLCRVWDRLNGPLVAEPLA